MKRLLRGETAQLWLARALSVYLRFVMRTTRWTMVGAENVAPFLQTGRVIVAFWHERLAVMPAFWLYSVRHAPPGRLRIYLLVSQHRDGQLIGAILRPFGMDTVSGSSTRGGVAGLKAGLDRLAQGAIVSIVPDGPLGPAFQPAPGVAALAALSGLPVLPLAAQTTRHRRAGGWDRMIFPLPFGRGTLVCGAPITVTRETMAEALPRIAAALTDAATRADRGCGVQ